LRAIARNEDITQDLSTLENPAIIDQLRGGEDEAAAQSAPVKAAARKPAPAKARKAAPRKAPAKKKKSRRGAKGFLGKLMKKGVGGVKKPARSTKKKKSAGKAVKKMPKKKAGARRKK
jgi:hypothetical protein